jgi:hypothetical protein
MAGRRNAGRAVGMAVPMRAGGQTRGVFVAALFRDLEAESLDPGMRAGISSDRRRPDRLGARVRDGSADHQAGAEVETTARSIGERPQPADQARRRRDRPSRETFNTCSTGSRPPSAPSARSSTCRARLRADHDHPGQLETLGDGPTSAACDRSKQPASSCRRPDGEGPARARGRPAAGSSSSTSWTWGP